MSDPCKGPFLYCTNETVTRTVRQSYDGGFNHTINRKITGEWEGVNLELSATDRTFRMSWDGRREENYDKVVRQGAYLTDCKDPRDTYHHSVSEDCLRKRTTLLYFDPLYKVLLVREEEQHFTFEVSSDKMALFRGKFGNSLHHKFILKKDDGEGDGKEIFTLYWQEGGGIQSRELYRSEYGFNPMPESTGQGTWGLYGNIIQKTCATAEDNVSMILVVPQPQSLAIPIDCDVNEWGFYDYLATEGGFIKTDLPELDGGMDFFYPEWCRNMMHDEIWRAEADSRYSIAWGPLPRPEIVPSSEYHCPAPSYSLGPCGNCVNVQKYGTFWSFVVNTRDGVKVFNELRLPGGKVVNPNSELSKIVPLRDVTYYPSIGLK